MEPHSRHDRYLDMGLDDAKLVREASPASNLPLSNQTVPIVIAVGANETPGYIDQAESYCRSCVSRGHDARVLLSRDDHHFSVIGRLGEPEHELTQALIELAQ